MAFPLLLLMLSLSLTGQETTSNQLSFTLFEILKHPNVENRYFNLIYLFKNR